MNPFVWDAAVGRYRHRTTGRFVPRGDVLNALRTALDAERDVAGALADQLRHAEISLTEFREGMRQIIKNVHLYSAALAKGGWERLTQADYGRVGQIVREEYQFLETRVEAIAFGTTPLDGRVGLYAKQYAQAGIETYWQVDRAVADAAGYTTEENILHGGDHCVGCRDATAMGKVPIGTLPPIGSRDCRRNCLCSLKYS